MISCVGKERSAKLWKIQLKLSLYVIVGMVLGAAMLLGAQLLPSIAANSIEYLREVPAYPAQSQEATRDGANAPHSLNNLEAADMQPTKHARGAGVSDCLANIDAMTRLSVNGAYTAVSTWNQRAPNERLFNSIIGQSTDNQNSPKAISVVVATPTKDHQCDAAAVEVRPSALSCPDLERTLTQNSYLTEALIAGTPVLKVDPRLRYLLLPAVGKSCVIVAVRTIYGN